MIKLNVDQINIMGRSNFSCSQIAPLLITGGVYEAQENKAGYEQAVFIHWALGLYERHGDKWSDEANAILRLINQELSSKGL